MLDFLFFKKMRCQCISACTLSVVVVAESQCSFVHVSDGVDGSKPFARSRRGLPAADDDAAGDADADALLTVAAVLSRRFFLSTLSVEVACVEPLLPLADVTDASDFDRPVLRRRGALRLGPRTARRSARTYDAGTRPHRCSAASDAVTSLATKTRRALSGYVPVLSLMPPSPYAVSQMRASGSVVSSGSAAATSVALVGT